MANPRGSAAQQVRVVEESGPARPAPEGPRGLSLLWKTEDWLAVWVGFLVILVVLAGVTVKIPKFKWTTDGEFTSWSRQLDQGVDKLSSAAGEQGEAALAASLAAGSSFGGHQHRRSEQHQDDAGRLGNGHC